MIKRVLSTAAILALIVGCGNHGGSEFLGKWVNLKSEKRTMEIVQNGDNFIIRQTAPSWINGKIETSNIPATLKDGTLQVQTGLGVTTLAVDRSTGHLTSGNNEYKRVD